jgi:hypothetical protein
MRTQGFLVEDSNLIAAPTGLGKDALRELHKDAVLSAREKASPGMKRHEDEMLSHFADGSDVRPREIRPVLREVLAGSKEELLFRYAKLHWSIPVSAGYGRRLRFCVMDSSNGKLIGLIGLGDPVISLGPRDRWIDWSREVRHARLRFIADAFVLGAVPPYSRMLGGKLVALLAVSSDVVGRFREKYEGRPSKILRRVSGDLAAITTTSALGRSSIYNRLTYRGRKVMTPVGFTAGSGEFHFANGLYGDILSLARASGQPSAKNAEWGSGWRSRREVVKRILPLVGLPRELIYHQVRREVYLAPLARNTREFLRGEVTQLDYELATLDDTTEWCKERWILPRAARALDWQDFKREDLRLWE